MDEVWILNAIYAEQIHRKIDGFVKIDIYIDTLCFFDTIFVRQAFLSRGVETSLKTFMA